MLFYIKLNALMIVKGRILDFGMPRLKRIHIQLINIRKRLITLHTGKK